MRKSIKYLFVQAVFWSVTTLIIYLFNMFSLWGDTFIKRYDWSFLDILTFVAAANIAMSPFKLEDM